MGNKMGYCPFCGSFDTHLVHESRGSGASDCFVMCAACRSKGPAITYHEGDEPNDEALMDLWNTRISITKKKIK